MVYDHFRRFDFCRPELYMTLVESTFVKEADTISVARYRSFTRTVYGDKTMWSITVHGDEIPCEFPSQCWVLSNCRSFVLRCHTIVGSIQNLTGAAVVLLQTQNSERYYYCNDRSHGFSWHFTRFGVLISENVIKAHGDKSADFKLINE